VRGFLLAECLLVGLAGSRPSTWLRVNSW